MPFLWIVLFFLDSFFLCLNNEKSVISLCKSWICKIVHYKPFFFFLNVCRCVRDIERESKREQERAQTLSQWLPKALYKKFWGVGVNKYQFSINPRQSANLLVRCDIRASYQDEILFGIYITNTGFQGFSIG